ncbi:CHASE domain-containing protein [Aromatoleum evansii]|uniref:CHASE domain-containing protein n=2 Tax=Aromatoleum evansii TaxID=59406 RepID=UPI0030DA1BCC
MRMPDWSPLGWAGLAVGVVLTAVVWVHDLRAHHAEEALRLARAGDVARDALERRLQGDMEVLRGLQGLFMASDEVTRFDFRRYAFQLDLANRHAGVRGHAFVRHVPAAAAPTFVAAVRADRSLDPLGYPRFAIRPPRTADDVHYVVDYVEPFLANLEQFGANFAADPARRLAAEQAATSGAVVGTGVGDLGLAEGEPIRGFVLFAPVYTPERRLRDVADRRAALQGWVAAIVDFDELMRDAFPPPLLDQVRVRLRDAVSGGRVAPWLLYDSHPALGASRTDARDVVHALEFGGRSWLLEVSAKPESLATDASLVAVPLLGAGVSWMLAVVLTGLSRARRQAESTANRFAADAAHHQRLLQGLFDVSPDCIKLIDLRGRLLTINQAGLAMLEAEHVDEVLGHGAEHLLVESDRAPFAALVTRVFAGEPGSLEYALIACRGTRRVMETYAVPLRDSAGAVSAMLAVSREVTAARAAEAQTERTLHEKETLLREIHHRVKNNLQVISSLLSLQTAHVAEPAVRALLRESQGRVRSMALVHEKLYRAADLAAIDLADYTWTLLRCIEDAWGRRARLEVAITNVALEIGQAIPCGLIINELVSNALKHAFPLTPGTVRVGAAVATGEVVLEVADDGVGFPGDLDFRNTASLGLQLVNTLADQLGGRVTLEGKAGCAFCIAFPHAGRKEQQA